MKVLRQLHIQNFRCFRDHSITFEGTSIAVGKNNAGKSTLVDTLLLLSAVVNRRGGSFVPPPRWLELPRFKLCLAPSIKHLGLNLTTVFHRYGEPPARITATFSNGARVTIYVGREETIYATIESQGNWVTSPNRFVALSLP